MIANGRQGEMVEQFLAILDARGHADLAAQIRAAIARDNPVVAQQIQLTTGDGGNATPDAAAQAQAKLEAETKHAKGITEMQAPVGRNAMRAAKTSITDRLASIISNLAVAAGEEDNSVPKGLWISGVYGTSKQGTLPNQAGYSAAYFGPTIGGDINVDDNNIVGIAYSYILSNYKFKDNLNKKLDVKSNVISLYSHSQINEDIIWDNILSVSFSKVKVKDSGLNPADASQSATAKHNNTAYSLDTKLGYRIPTDDKSLSIIPYIGLEIGRSKDSSYTLGKVAVGSKSESPVAGTIGIQVAKKYLVSEGTTITPALSAGLEKNFNKKNQLIKAKFVGTNEYFPTQNNKNSKALQYNIGASVLLNHQNIEIGVGYDCHLQKKYQAHQGYLKLKVAL